MTEQQTGTEPAMVEPERRAAHERLATGGLARWTRFCATHPWRIVFGWIGIIALLIVTVATVGGSLKDEFTIPGSESQKAIDPASDFCCRVFEEAGIKTQKFLGGQMLVEVGILWQVTDLRTSLEVVD